MAKYLAQLVVLGAQVVGRAFTRALRQEIEASQRAAQQRQSSNGSGSGAATNAKLGMTLQEAQQILNLDKVSDKELLERHYQHLFAVNEKAKGGSFYLQSKAFFMAPLLRYRVPVVLNLSATSYRHFSTDSRDGPPNHLIYDHAISEPNIRETIDRMKRIRLGKLTSQITGSGKSASIFIPFCHDIESGAPSVLFTRRSFKLSKHKGEVCFPGGFEEQHDKDVIDSAVRELIEEIGVHRSDLKVHGALNPVPFRTFPLYPVIGYLHLNHDRQLVVNPDEVDSVHVIPLEQLIQKSNWYKTKFSHGWTTPVFLDPDRKHPRIWGMTASILYITLANLMPEHFEFDFEYLLRGKTQKFT